jgi:hypothetical protein
LKKLLLLLSAVLCAHVWAAGQSRLLSPDEFLPHKLGTQFTPHHLLVDYFEHVAANSELVKIQTFGSTPEDRPQIIAIIASRRNQNRLEDIRLNNLRMAGMAANAPKLQDPPAIVWLSYSVHGNEASGSESAMAVLYDLVNPANTETKTWLENTVVIIDPSENPDGYDHYSHWFRKVAHRIPHPDISTREHAEPWPRGRANHYQFDLNRDWAWATQLETQNRIKLYQQWLPHVHPDIHEQGIESPYYFAPAAEPYHKYITQWQRDFQLEIGRNHARYFDQNGWLYFTKERFDLLYPSYGDTYPTFNGAIGMTYEQAGNSRAGRAVMLRNGDTLTLNDRVQHHKTTSLSTIEVVSKNAGALLRNFQEYFGQAEENPPGQYKAFVIKSKPVDEHRLKTLTELLAMHGIRFGTVGSRMQKVSGYNYQSGKSESFEVEPGDLVVSSFQPKSVLAQVLLEPEPVLSDSLTYDITAWSLVHAYGLEGYACQQKIKADREFRLPEFRGTTIGEANNAYAMVAPWTAVNSAAFMAEFLGEGITARYATKPFNLAGQQFDSGTLVIARDDNRRNDAWASVTLRSAQKHGQKLVPVKSGFAEAGSDLGSNELRLVAPPRVAVSYGDGIDVNSYGYVWHFLEADLNLGFGAIEKSAIFTSQLDDYNVLILPEGTYKSDGDGFEKLSRWIEQGGKVIAIGDALQLFEGKDGFGLKGPVHAEEENARPTPVEPYGNADRAILPDGTLGAIVRVKLDTTHPLAFGLGPQYFSLKTNSHQFTMTGKGWNVGSIGDEVFSLGFIGYRLKDKLKNTCVFGDIGKGRGRVVYLSDDPLFRGFWYQGKLLFSNALFFN